MRISDWSSDVCSSDLEIFSLPAEKGVTLDISQSSGSAERYPAWSPDGKQIAWWGDKSGEYELYLFDQVSGETRKITNLGKGFRYHIYWSPDSKKIAFVDQPMQINVLDVATGKTIPARSAERRVGKGCASKCKSWWNQHHYKKKK